MKVQVTRPYGVQINGAEYLLEPGGVRELPDGSENSPHVKQLIDCGELLVVRGAVRQDVEPVDTTGTKKPIEVIADVKSGKAAESAKPVPDQPK